MNSTKWLAAVAVLVVLGSVVVAYVQTRSDSKPVGDLRDVSDRKPVSTAKVEEAEGGVEAQPQSVAPEDKVRVFGTVTDAKSGTPIASAELRGRRNAAAVRDNVFEEDPGSIATSDENGTFELQLAAGDYDLVLCVAPGYTRTRMPIGDQSGADIRLDFVMQRAAAVGGKVVDAGSGEPIKGIRVDAVGAQETMIDMIRSRGERGKHDATDDEGQYRIDGLEPGSYRIVVVARSSGYLFKPENAVTLDLAEEAEYEEVNFSLERGASAVGKVIDPSQLPVADARVAAIPSQMLQKAMRGMRSMDPSSIEPRRERTTNEGTFVLNGLEFETEYRLVVEARNFAKAYTQPFTIPKGAPPHDETIPLIRGSNISGVVVKADGTPAADERLMLLPATGEEWSVFNGPDTTKSKDDGTFGFQNVNPGAYTLGRDENFDLINGPAKGGTLELDVDGVTDITDVKLVISDAKPVAQKAGEGTITGSVLGIDGTPAVNVRVDARRTENPRETAGGTTDETGAFTLTGLSGFSYDLSVEAESGTAVAKFTPIGANVVLQLEPPARISGTVVDPTGEPVPSAVVHLAEERAGSPSAQIATIVERMMRRSEGGKNVDAYGRFEFERVTPGDYKLNAESTSVGSSEALKLNVGPGDDVSDLELVLDPGSTVSGLVVDGSGLPVKGAFIQLTPVEDDSMMDMMSKFMPAGMMETAGSTSSDDLGAFTISKVPSGSYHVFATHSTYAKFVGSLTVAQKQDVSNYRITLGQGGRARGMYTVEGKPQPGATIMLIGVNGLEMAQTDSQGLFDVTGLTTGSYMAYAVNPSQFITGNGNLQFNPQVIDIAEGEISDLNLGPGEGTTVSGSINGASGAMTIVALRKPGSPPVEMLNPNDLNSVIDMLRFLEGQSIVGQDGAFTIDGVEPGTYSLEVYSLNFDIQNPDLTALMNMQRTPAFVQQIEVGEEVPPIAIDLSQG